MGISTLLSGIIHSRRSGRAPARSQRFVFFQRWTAIIGEWSFLHRLTKSGASQPRGSPMSVVQIVEPEAEVRAGMREIGAKARVAAREVANAPAEKKNRALLAGAGILRERANAILAANELDCADARRKNLSAALIDRLTLNPARIEAMAGGLEEGAALADPVGRVLATYTRPNGLMIERVSTPLGVVGVIYESRPNVTADAGALCLKSGNAVVLRGGSDSFHSSAAIHACLVEGLKEAGLPEAAIARAPFASREAVGEMLKGLDGALDVIVPRGGKSRWIGFSARREYRCSRISKASCMSMSIGRPISTRRSSSSSTPRCGAPASAARPRRCWSIA